MSNSMEEMLQGILSNPETAEKISSLISSLGGENSSPAPSESTPALPFGLDNPETLMKLTSMYSKISNQDDPRVNLLLALKPYMSEKRCEKAEYAIKILKLSKMTGMLGELNIL